MFKVLVENGLLVIAKGSECVEIPVQEFSLQNYPLDGFGYRVITGPCGGRATHLRPQCVELTEEECNEVASVLSDRRPVALSAYKRVLRAPAGRTALLMELWRAHGHQDRIELFAQRQGWCYGHRNSFLISFRYALRGGTMRA